MTKTTVSDAIVIPQSSGTGLADNVAQIDAAVMGLLARYRGDGGYVDTQYAGGLQFQNHDASNDTVEISPGACFVADQSASTSNNRGNGGNPQAESSTTSGYDVELPGGHVYLVLIPTTVEIAVSDSTLNAVHVDLDVTSNNGVSIEHDGSSAASPSATSLKLGETNPDDASQDTRANDNPSITASAVSTDKELTIPVYQSTSDVPTVPEGTIVFTQDDNSIYVEDGT